MDTAIEERHAGEEPEPAAGSIWRNRSFAQLWAAQTGSVWGTLIGQMAVSFLAVLTLEARPWQVAVLAACRQLPGMLTGLVAGVWVDRLPKRPLMISADLGRALLWLTVPAAWWLGVLRIEQIWLVVVLSGVLTIVFDVAYHSYLPVLLPPQRLIEGNSKLTASESVAEFGAFAVSGWLVQALTAPITIALDAASFLWSALLLGRIRTREAPATGPEEREGMWREAVAGLALTARDAIFRTLLGAQVTLGLGSGFMGALYVLYVSRDLAIAPGVQGLIYGIGGVTSFAGAMIAGRLAQRAGIGGALAIGYAAAALGSWFTPLAFGPFPMIMVFLVIAQVIPDPGWTVYNIQMLTIVQGRSPAAALGRINATMKVAGQSAMLLGGLLAGLLSERFGVRTAMLTGSTCMTAGILLLLRSPIGKLRTLETTRGE